MLLPATGFSNDSLSVANNINLSGLSDSLSLEQIRYFSWSYYTLISFCLKRSPEVDSRWRTKTFSFFIGDADN